MKRLLLLAALAPSLYRAAIRGALRFNLARVRKGDTRLLFATYAHDVHFRFPGDSSWAVELHGKAEHERWLRRFIRAGLQISADEVILKGFPWRQTICVRGRIHLDDPQDGRVYDNRYVIWGQIAWGKLRRYEVYEDTQKSKQLDEYLDRRQVAG